MATMAVVVVMMMEMAIVTVVKMRAAIITGQMTTSDDTKTKQNKKERVSAQLGMPGAES